MKASAFILATMVPLLAVQAARAGIKVTVGHSDNEHARPGFVFANVPPPTTNNAARTAQFVIVDGAPDPNGGGLAALNDGKLPNDEDQPAANFFFNTDTGGGRLRLDFPNAISIRQVNTYSWHPNTRGPQIYKLYACDGSADGYNASPKEGTDPESCGWKLIAQINTESDDSENGGQYGVSISATDGVIGKYQHLLFDIACTEDNDGDGNTFYSEIDVLGAGASVAPH